MTQQDTPQSIVYTATSMSRRHLRRLIPWLEAEGYDPMLVIEVRPLNRRAVWIHRYEANEYGKLLAMGGRPVVADPVLHEASTSFPLPI